MISAIILAAGKSSRMGQPKLALPLRGKTLLQHTVDNVLAADVGEVLVVLGALAGQYRADLVGRAVKIMENPDYAQGQSTSVKAGLRQVSEAAQAAMFVLGDQPLVGPAVLNQLLSLYRSAGKCIVAPLYDGQRGNPVIWSRALFPELLAVSGDQGGREVLLRHKIDMATLNIADPLAGLDVDTWEAYQQLQDALDT